MHAVKRSAQAAVHPRQPMLWAAAAFAAGIVAGTYAWRPAVWWIGAALVFGFAAAYFVRDRTSSRTLTAKSLTFCLLFFLGALNIQLRSGTDASAERILAYADLREAPITAHVIAEGEIKPGGFGGTVQQIDVETESAGWPGPEKQEAEGSTASSRLRSVIRLSIHSKEPLPEMPLPTPASHDGSAAPGMHAFRYGERLRFLAKLRSPRNFRNPGAFDYEAYLADNGIAALGSAKAEEVELLPGFAGSRVEFWRTRVHRSIIGMIHRLWPERQAALIDAMVIGENAFIERSTKVDFQRSGTYHILVVSGMNVSILAAVVFWVLRRMRMGDAVASVVTVLLSVSYAFLTNVGAPVWRAVLMMTLYLGARLLYRDRSMLSALGAAALGFLVFDPHALLGASFQLTFLAVLLIAGAGVPVLERTTQPYRQGLGYMEATTYDARVEPRVAQLRLDLRMIGGRVAKFIPAKVAFGGLTLGMRTALAVVELIFISALMQAGLALPMAYYFHRATVIGIPSNMTAVTLTGVLMPASLSAIVWDMSVPCWHGFRRVWQRWR
jgi:competence protein ComEC